MFASRVGTPLNWRNVEVRGMDKTVEAAGLDVPGKRRPTMHDLRSTFASMLISEGVDVVQVSKQLGHKKASITLDVYADLFDAARHEDELSTTLEARFGSLVELSGNAAMANHGEPADLHNPGNVTLLHELARSGD